MKRVISARALDQFSERYRSRGETIGFVPTMGDLHDGHVSLIRRARAECDNVAVSIFVNPMQFGPNEDYKRYPRSIARDSVLCRRAKVDLLFTPTVNTMYPVGFQTSVEVERLSQHLCGRDRPGHFKGVATVVAKLFHLVRPDVVYFGLKDYQQAMVIRQMVRDLSFRVQLKFCPTVRESDGLALSSRNRYLSSEERLRALEIYRTLKLGRRLIREGLRNAGDVRKRMIRHLNQYVDRIHYISIVDPETLETVSRINGRVLLAIAARIGKTRLIDNLIV
jgi:pantoate--beta-alanine ligase